MISPARSSPASLAIVDAHHHLWKVSRGDYHWMTPNMTVLARDYLIEDLEPHLRKSSVTRTVLVQAAQTEAETDFLLDLASQSEFVAGVTGWLDLADPDFPKRLERFRRHPKFIAVRPMLQEIQDDAWILKPVVLGHLKHLADLRFPFEFLTFPRHLPYVLRALGETPGLHAMIDHLSKPPIASGAMEPWASLIREVAEFPDVHCKLSGMVTEADHAHWSPDSLAPYVHHAIDVFGADRLMFGSDWPVCRLAAEYGEVVNALRTILGARLGPQEIDKIFRGNAERFYGLAR
jgi:L-fuconolactonase